MSRKEFFEDINSALTDDGIMVVQAESMYYDRDFISHLHAQTKQVFFNVGYYFTLVPSYPSGSIGFIYGSKVIDISRPKTSQLDDSSTDLILSDLVYYTPEIHSASFVLPAFLKKLLN